MSKSKISPEVLTQVRIAQKHSRKVNALHMIHAAAVKKQRATLVETGVVK